MKHPVVMFSIIFRFKKLLDAEEEDDEDTVEITVTNAEPFDSIQGASALATPPCPSKAIQSIPSEPEDHLYSIPTSNPVSLQAEADKAFTEYTFVKEVKVEPPAPKKIMSDSELEIYSAASTLSLGETVILSDGWLNRNRGHREAISSASNSLTSTPINNRLCLSDTDDTQSTIVLTLDVDTSASVI